MEMNKFIEKMFDTFVMALIYFTSVIFIGALINSYFDSLGYSYHTLIAIILTLPVCVVLEKAALFILRVKS